MKNFAKSLIFLALVFLFFFGVAEIVLRTTHLFGARLSYSQPDSVLGYRLSPNRKYWHFHENTHAIEGRLNSFGWRDHDRTLAKEKDTYRVALLGDSQVESINVELDSTFASIAERRLSRNRPGRVEILNFGRSSFTQTEELILLRDEVQTFSPDAILVMLLPHNDINDVRRETAASSLRPFFLELDDGRLVLDTSFNQGRAYRMRAFLNPWKQNSAVISLLVERYNLYRRMRNAPPTVVGAESRKISGALTLCTANPDPEIAESYRLNKILLGKMADFCREQSLPFGLIVCSWVYKTEDISEFRKLDPTFNPDFLEEDLGAFADSIGIEFLGVQKPFRRSYEKSKVGLDWGHWNYDGHRLVADLLERKLEQMMSIRYERTP